jgi:anti-anti-sigma regulatory factor
MPVEPFPGWEPTVSRRKSCCPERADEGTHVQTMVLISPDGVLDGQTGRAVRTSVHRLLDLGIRSIFLDLSGIDRVDENGVHHLVETLSYGDALGGGVVLLEGGVALAAYFGDA